MSEPSKDRRFTSLNGSYTDPSFRRCPKISFFLRFFSLKFQNGFKTLVLEGGVGLVTSARPIYRSIKQVFLTSPDSRSRFFNMAPESRSLGKTSISNANKTFGTTHVMVSALGCLQRLQIEWFERHSRPAVFARRKPHFERHRLFGHDEHSVFGTPHQSAR